MKTLDEKERLAHAAEMLSHAHYLYGVQCQNCQFYKPDKALEDMDNYRGTCVSDEYNQHNTYWSQYCDDFIEGKYENA